MSFANVQNQSKSTNELANNQITYGYKVQTPAPAPTLVYGGEWRDANGNYLGEVWCIYNNGTYIGYFTIAA